MRKPLAITLTILLLAAVGTSWAQSGPQPRLATTRLSAGMHNIVAELATTPEQRQVGMMFRTQMADHEGMLFVFDAPQQQCFWMRNTLIPLAIAFIGDDGRIVNIVEMQPKSDASHCSAKPVRYALEMNAGWFSKRGLKAGAQLRGKPFAN
jgi:uncharacterized membrane protein (UPF0127 family)